MALFGRQGTTYAVRHRPRGDADRPWAVIVDGSTTISRHRTKRDAVGRAREVARNNTPSELNVYTEAGGFQRGSEYD